MLTLPKHSVVSPVFVLMINVSRPSCISVKFWVIIAGLPLAVKVMGPFTASSQVAKLRLGFKAVSIYLPGAPAIFSNLILKSGFTTTMVSSSVVLTTLPPLSMMRYFNVEGGGGLQLASFKKDEFILNVEATGIQYFKFAAGRYLHDLYFLIEANCAF